MEFYETVETRRTIRKFTRPAAEDQLLRIICAGTKAMPGRDCQPWEFIAQIVILCSSAEVDALAI